MPHTKTTMTEVELRDYLREHVGVVGSVSGDAEILTIASGQQSPVPLVTVNQPKKRGRPKGSKNRLKQPK